ncbi:uncharacterized protein PG986_001888 [Apiospora aurea]|uniref:Nonsense-mediated mRNA decay factor n=1 Tax=Apiospora aurea TaxID=335848 RepID=A0ABR1QY41_9PEZI
MEYTSWGGPTTDPNFCLLAVKLEVSEVIKRGSVQVLWNSDHALVATPSKNAESVRGKGEAQRQALLKFRQNAIGGTEVYGHQMGPVYRNHHEYRLFSEGLKIRDEDRDRTKLHLFALVRRLFELAGGREDTWQYHTCLQRDYTPARGLILLGSFVGASEFSRLQDLGTAKTLQFLSSCKAFKDEHLTEEVLEQRTELIAGLPINLPLIDLPAAFLVDLSRIKCAEFRIYKMETTLQVPMLEDHITSVGFFLCWRSCFDPSVELIGYVRSPEGRQLIQPHLDIRHGSFDVGRLAISLLVMHWFFHLQGTDNSCGEIHSGVDCLKCFHSLLHSEEIPNAQWVIAKHLRAFSSLVPEVSAYLQSCGTWNRLEGDNVDPVLEQFWRGCVQGDSVVLEEANHIVCKSRIQVFKFLPSPTAPTTDSVALPQWSTLEALTIPPNFTKSNMPDQGESVQNLSTNMPRHLPPGDSRSRAESPSNNAHFNKTTQVGRLCNPDAPGSSPPRKPGKKDSEPQPTVQSQLATGQGDLEVFDEDETYVPQLKTRPIDHLQLVAEVKGIYAGLVMVESKCIEVETAQKTQTHAKLNNEQWQALIALHRILLHEHHDFFLASQHPTARSSLRRLGAKYYMPGRMWKHGIHAFLELLRHRLPASLEHMLTFIYLAYSIMALLYETVPAFEATWMECLGDLGRYRMAIEDDDLRDREVWTSVSQRWYSKASDVVPKTGRLYHHLAILARPNVLQQLFYYSKALSAPEPFESAWASIMTLFDPLLGSDSQRSRILPIDFAFVKAQGIMFSGKLGDEYQSSVTDFLSKLDNHISRTTRKWMESGYYIGIANCCALLGWGKESSFIYQTIRPKKPDNKETEETYRTRTIPDPNDRQNAKALEQARYLAEGTYNKVFSRCSDPNILPCLHTILVFHRYLILFPSAMSLLEATFPWKLVSMLLNSLLLSYRVYERIQRSDEFPRPDNTAPRPLPEDFALRGLLWADKYFPSDWFSNDKIDDDEKYLEVASMTYERKERILWLGVSIARHGKWLLYDEELHQFSVPFRFDQEIDVSMGVDTDEADISRQSRASSLALSSASNDASIQAMHDDEDMPDIDDGMTRQLIGQ